MNNPPVLLGDVTGAILVGGRSSRLGCDKVLLLIDGAPLLTHLYSLLQPLVAEILLIGHHRTEFDAMGFRVVEDILPGTGPLGGICTALIAASTPFVFVVAGDMPFLSASLIGLVAGARLDADAVIPRGPRGLEPLCAVYSRSCIEALRSSLEKGNRRIRTALDGLKILTPEIQVKKGEQDPFFNINYPEDLDIFKD